MRVQCIPGPFSSSSKGLGTRLGSGATIAIQWHRRPWLSEGLSQATLVMTGARGTVTGAIPWIAAICHRAKLCYCSITTQHLISRRKFTSWNCFDSNGAQTKFVICLRSIRINTVITVSCDHLSYLLRHKAVLDVVILKKFPKKVFLQTLL